MTLKVLLERLHTIVVFVTICHVLLRSQLCLLFCMILYVKTNSKENFEEVSFSSLLRKMLKSAFFGDIQG